MSASPHVANASVHHVLCGPAVVPAGCAPVLVQAVLEDPQSFIFFIFRGVGGLNITRNV